MQQDHNVGKLKKKYRNKYEWVFNSAVSSILYFCDFENDK